MVKPIKTRLNDVRLLKIAVTPQALQSAAVDITMPFLQII